MFLLLVTRQQAVRHPPPERILWIGAHPDDEAFVAPLLGRSCAEKEESCSLLVMTRGEEGGNAAIRSAEMQRAADFLGAHLTLWTFSDVGNEVDAVWSAEAGSHDALALSSLRQPRGSHRRHHVFSSSKPWLIF
jgi:LmbE family N-acetylglucosaminyl deacetylase